MESKFCSRCGSKLAEGQSFCSNCGEKIVSSVQEKKKDNDVDTEKEIKIEKTNENLKEPKKKKTSVGDIIRYIFGGLLFVAGVSEVTQSQWWGIFNILFGLFLCPFVYRNFLYKYVNNKQTLKVLQVILPFIMFVLAVVFTPSDNIDTVDGENEASIRQNGEKVTVEVVDFSPMTKAEIETWCNEKKIICSFKNEYNDTVENGQFVSQSIESEKIIYQGEKITIVYSLGKEPTTEQKNALRTAESYAKIMHMSKQGIYDQLTSEYGEGFDKEAAQYAIDNIEWDWNANALATAKSYRDTMSMSKNRIYDQLTSQYGEKFTKEEAQYAIDHLDD